MELNLSKRFFLLNGFYVYTFISLLISGGPAVF